MSQSTVGVRYAKALFLYASDKNSLKDVYSDMNSLLDLYNQSSEFKEFIKNPVIGASQKIVIANNLFEKTIHPDTLKFLTLLFENRREDSIVDIIISFQEMFRDHFQIKKATLITSTTISDKTKSDFLNTLKSKYAAEIELESFTDESIIGGFILQMDDMQYDASIAKGLKNIKNELLKTTISNKL